ncbi:MAG: YMGG-like glycine zipper-containing protein [Planctomycetota bacterium]
MPSQRVRTSSLILCVAALAAASGCQSDAQTGALVGAGIGALAGQAIGGDTESTLIGTAVGSGVGYVIGNERDKARARSLSDAQPAAAAPTHSDVGPLAGTRWELVSLNPSDIAGEFTSKIVEFRGTGRVITTTTWPDGRVEVADETYRVVGDTLIVNQPGYIINARYDVSGSDLTISAQEFSAVLRRL